MATFEKIQDSRRLLGYAISFSPTSIVDQTVANPFIGEQISHFIHDQVAANEYFQRRPVDSTTFTILKSGITDIFHIVEHAMSHHNQPVSQQEMIEYFQRDEAIRTIARHALLPEKALRNILTRQDAPVEIVDGNIVTTPYFEMIEDHYRGAEERGCPAAANARGDIHPLFIAFSKWASEISIRSLYKKQEF